VAVIDADPGPSLIGKKLAVTLIGAVIMLTGFYLWALEGNEGYHLHLEDEPAGGSGKKH
jgi:cytochrome c oxidase subunit 1